MAMGISAISPAVVLENGGHKIEVTGTFNLGHEYMIYLGTKSGIFDHACYSGVPGQGNVIRPYTTTALVAYTPRLYLGSGQHVTVRDLTVPEIETLAAALTVCYEWFSSAVFSIRKLLPNFYKTGPRDIDQVAPI